MNYSQTIGNAGIIPNMTNGSLTKTAKGWIAKVTNGREAVISASVKMKDGSVRKMGEQKYRIKTVPKPEAWFGTLESGTHPAAALLGQRYITAVLPNFVFENVKFNVVKYACMYVPRRGNAQIFAGSGPVINDQLKRAIQTAKTGDKVLVDEIMATGPGGISKRLTPIVITIR